MIDIRGIAAAAIGSTTSGIGGIRATDQSSQFAGKGLAMLVILAVVLVAQNSDPSAQARQDLADRIGCQVAAQHLASLPSFGIPLPAGVDISARNAEFVLKAGGDWPRGSNHLAQRLGIPAADVTAFRARTQQQIAALPIDQTAALLQTCDTRYGAAPTASTNEDDEGW